MLDTPPAKRKSKTDGTTTRFQLCGNDASYLEETPRRHAVVSEGGDSQTHNHPGFLTMPQ
jgi:hypothetical protein